MKIKILNNNYLLLLSIFIILFSCSSSDINQLIYNGDLGIENNTSLKSFDGLNKLTSITGGVFIKDNTALINLNGLNNLSSCKFTEINNNDNLIDLEGLDKLETIEESFNIVQNDNLINLSGISQLSSIGISSRISTNKKLTNLEGLDNLASMGGNRGDKPESPLDVIFSIQNYVELKNYCALTNLFSSDGMNGFGMRTDNNAYNPSIVDIKNGNCSQ